MKPSISDLTEGIHQVLYAELWNEPDCWDRFLRYAQLVREVTFYSGLDQESEMNTMTLLAVMLERNAGQAVFPSLRIFTWKSTRETQDDDDMIGLMFGHQSIGLKGILLCIRYAAPFLEAYIDTSICAHVPLEWIADELAQLQNLRIIQITAPVTHRDIDAALSTLPLTHLRVSVIPESASAANPLSAASLRVLDIHGAPSDLAAMLPSWSLPSLEHAKISVFDERRDNKDIYKPALAAALVAPLPHAFLRTLHISLSGASSPRRAAPLPLAQFLRPSFQLHGLESFILRVHDWYVKLSADDDAFSELANAWPLLRTLEMDFPTWHEEGPVPTPLVLLALVRSCTQLQELSLPYLDYTVDLETLPPRGALHTAHPLRRLYIADDRTKNLKANDMRKMVEPLRNFVIDLFPHLSVSPDVRHYRKGRAPWTEVFVGLRRGPHSRR